jgi:hypothetical protein
MPKKKKVVPWIFGDGPEPIPADLTVDQKRHISASAGIVFSTRDWKNIERARRDYMSWQWTKRQAVEYKHLENRIKNLIRDSNALIRSIRIDKLGVILWTRLSEGEDLPFVPSDLHQTLLELERRARLVLKENRRLFESGIGPTTISPWDRLVDTLAAIFRHNNVPTTSARSSRAKNPKPSRFVTFIRAVMDTLPSEISEHTHSWRATAEATAKSLSKIKRAQKQANPPPA